MAASSNIAPVCTVGRYAVYEEIGTGGMATVHVGRLSGAIGFARTVAIKRLHPPYARNAEFVSMFVDEARVAARIRHPNVVQTLDVVVGEGELFLVMEYIPGESLGRLRRLLRARGVRMPHRVVSAVMAGALQGIHAAHETKDEHGRSLDLVHRDISPGNIIVGVDGLSRVLDFGIARAAGRVHTSQVTKVKGKLGYVSPEQVESGSVTRRADIYSASVVLWELLTAKRLFQGDSQNTVIARVLKGEVVPPSQIVSDIPTAYDRVVLKGLARDPDERYASAREMALALEECAGSESIADVAAWLEEIAGEQLRERAEKVARFERQSGADISELRAMVDELASGSSRPPPPSSPPAASAPADAAAGSLVANGGVQQSAEGPRNTREERPKHRRVVPLSIAAAVLGVALASIAYFATRSSSSAAVEPAPAKRTPQVELAQPHTTIRAPATAPPQAVDESSAGKEQTAALPTENTAPQPASSASSPSIAKRPAAKPNKSASPFGELGGRL
jgi:serine/threonine-protein kinase